MLQGEVCEAGRAQHRAERQEVALICKIHSVFILGMVVMGWGRGRGYGMSLHFITAWALALSFGTCHESKESLALITSHKYCIASDFRDGWQQARNYNELLQRPSSHKLQLFFSEPARLPTSGFWFRRYGWVFMCLVRDTYILSSLLDPFTPFSPHCLPGWRGGGDGAGGVVSLSVSGLFSHMPSENWFSYWKQYTVHKSSCPSTRSGRKFGPCSDCKSFGLGSHLPLTP